MNTDSSYKKQFNAVKDSWKFKLTFFEEIFKLNFQLREEIKARWNRTLPLGDALFDRWEKAAYLGFKEGSSIYDSSMVIGDVQVGENTWIGPFTVLDGSGGLKIGDNCSISAGVQIYTHDSVKWAISGGKSQYELESTSIGNYSYIGPMTIISKGIHIGDQCVIGANSFVRESIPPRSIAAGSPTRIIGKVEVDEQGQVKFVYS